MLRTGRILEDAWNWLARRVPREEMKTTHLWMKMLTERLAWVLGKAVGLYTPCVQGNNSWVASHQPAAGGRGGLASPNLRMNLCRSRHHSSIPPAYLPHTTPPTGAVQVHPSMLPTMPFGQKKTVDLLLLHWMKFMISFLKNGLRKAIIEVL